MKTFSFWKKSIYSAFIFFGTIILLTLVYAGVTNVFYSDLPNANSGSGLTVTSWNNLVNYANKAVKQDTEILTVTGGNVGIGTASPRVKLDVNGNLKADKIYIQTSGTVSGPYLFRMYGACSGAGVAENCDTLCSTVPMGQCLKAWNRASLIAIPTNSNQVCVGCLCASWQE